MLSRFEIHEVGLVRSCGDLRLRWNSKMKKKKSLKWGGRFMITHLRLEAVVLTEIKENEQDTVEFRDFD